MKGQLEINRQNKILKICYQNQLNRPYQYLKSNFFSWSQYLLFQLGQKVEKQRDMSSITYEQFDKCYKVKSKLGSGTSAEVSLIQSKTNRNQQYALKRIFLRTVDEVAANMNEVEIISLLKDKAVPKIYYYFTASNLTGDHPAFQSLKYHYEKKPILLGIIMERCQTDVETHILRIRNGLENHFDNGELWDFLKVMIDVLSKMQNLGILHRDIKPANILMNIQKDKKVFKLSDFGFSVYKNQFSIESITGTRDYTSPRVRGKFDRPHVNIDGINYKDDVFSLGKTLLEMMRLENCANEEININLQKIQQSFDPNVVYILKRMLTISEKERPDFLTIKAQMLQIQKKENPGQFVDLTTSNSEQNEQEAIRNYCQSQQYQAVSRQVPVTKGSQIQSQMTADSSRRKPSNYKQVGNYRERETQYIENQLSQVRIQQSVKYLTTITFNLANEIYCIQAAADYLLLGMNTRLGVIPLQNNQTKRIYLLQLVNLVPLGSLYKIKKVHVYQDYFLLILEQRSQFVYVKSELFFKVMKDVMENHEKYRQSHALKPAFPESNSPIYGGYKVYNLEYKSFDKLTLIKDADITSIHMLKTPLNGKTSRSLFAFSDGSLSFYNQQPFYQNDLAIEGIQVSENKIIITTKKDIKILSLLQSKSLSEQKKWQVEHSYLLKSEIVHLKVIECKKNQEDPESKVQSDSDDDNLVPFLEIVTADCKRIILGNNLQEITQTKLQVGSKTILYVLSSNFNYSIVKEEKSLDGESSAVKIKQSQNKNNDDLQFYYLTSAGKIKHSKSKKTLWQNPYKHFNKFHIGGNKIILTNFNGEIQILSFADEPPKRCMITQSQKQRHSQKAVDIPQYLSIRKSHKNVDQCQQLIFTKPQMNLLNKKQRESYRSKIQYSQITKLSILRKD